MWQTHVHLLETASIAKFTWSSHLYSVGQSNSLGNGAPYAPILQAQSHLPVAQEDLLVDVLRALNIYNDDFCKMGDYRSVVTVTAFLAPIWHYIN